MILTYNQILKEFKTFATNHKQIQNFGNGDLWEIVEHNQLADFNYPLFWVADQPANLGDGTFTWNGAGISRSSKSSMVTEIVLSVASEINRNASA